MMKNTEQAETKKLRELNIAESIQVRHAVEHARMTGTLRIKESLLAHCREDLGDRWFSPEFTEIHTVELEG